MSVTPAVTYGRLPGTRLGTAPASRPASLEAA